jgi:hypothetical protein
VSLLLYAVADGGLDTPPGVGVEERPLELLGDHSLLAIVSEHAEPPRLDELTGWAFERALEAQMAVRTVLPARFGTTFADRPGIGAALDERRRELLGRLDRVRGAVEFGIRVSWPAQTAEPAPVGPDAGTAYMLARVARARRAREISAEIDGALGMLAREAISHVLHRPSRPVTAAYLVDRDRAGEFAARAQALVGTIADAELDCSGPWPPYSFASGVRCA